MWGLSGDITPIFCFVTSLLIFHIYIFTKNVVQRQQILIYNNLKQSKIIYTNDMGVG